jgi:hypothetical protein
MVELLAWASLISLIPLLLAILRAIINRVHSPLQEDWTASSPESDWLADRRESGPRYTVRWHGDSLSWEPERRGR